MTTKKLKKLYPESFVFAINNGFELDQRKGHPYFQAPNGKKVFIATSPSDHRADKNTVRYLRRCALDE